MNRIFVQKNRIFFDFTFAKIKKTSILIICSLKDSKIAPAIRQFEAGE